MFPVNFAKVLNTLIIEQLLLTSQPWKLNDEDVSFTSLSALSANLTKWSNTLEQFVCNSRRIVWVCLAILWGWRIENVSWIILAHLSINFLSGYDHRKCRCFGNSETNLDESIPTGQFKIPGNTAPFPVDPDRNGSGIMVFVRGVIPVKYLSTENKPIEAFFFQINLHKKKCLVILLG